MNHVATVERIEAPGLDPIHVFWMNIKPCEGYVTVICYGSAWTAYFGAMSSGTIQEFFARVDVDYMVTKMQAPTLKDGKKHEAYLGRIVKAVQDHLRAQPQPAEAVQA